MSRDPAKRPRKDKAQQPSLQLPSARKRAGGAPASSVPAAHASSLSQANSSASYVNTWLPLGEGVRLAAYHPCGLYVLDKPEGILSHPNKKSEISRSLLKTPYSLDEECYNLAHTQHTPPPPAEPMSAEPTSGTQAELTPGVQVEPKPGTQADAQTEPAERDSAIPHKLYLLHRLDSATSGLLLLADNEHVAERVRTAFADGDVRKTYLALCACATRIRPGDKGRWSDRLQRERSGGASGNIHVRAGEGVSAVTDYVCKKVEPRTQSVALLELHPVSGRTHQLRVHSAGHGLPIIGDGKYGDFRLNRAIAQATGHKRLFLHAAALHVDFTLGGKTLRLHFQSAPPPSFEALLNSGSVLSNSMATAPRSATEWQQRNGSGPSGPAGKPQQHSGSKRSSTASKPQQHSQQTTAAQRQQTQQPSQQIATEQRRRT